MRAYAELDCRTNFSFLEGASRPEELAATAWALGLHALGVADVNTLAGVVRAHSAAKTTGVRFRVGSRLVFTDGTELIVYPRDRAAYGRLCRLLSDGKRDVKKAACRLTFEDAARAAAGPGAGWIALAPAPDDPDGFEARLTAWAKAFPGELYLAASVTHRGDDRARLNRLAEIAARAGAPLLATGRVLYHGPERRPLQDVLTCVREKTTIDRAGFRLQANAERHMKSPAEIARLFRDHPEAVARTVEVADRIDFSLEELRYEYPDEPVPAGQTPQAWLETLTWKGAAERFPDGVPDKVRANLEKELRLIEGLDYAPYFLTVHDVVAYARSQDILCQGRGSAANSAVCYCLGITSVNPAEIDLLFERFVSAERREPPDIDVDFEHERREEVIQYVYRRYGRDRAAIAATVISYRPRSAIRDVGKALGLSEDVTAALAGTVWGSYGSSIPDEHVRRAGLDPNAPRLRLALELAEELIGFPRHLSQHVGGFVLTRGPLVETVPIGNAAMPDRTFIEWDKDDIEDLGIMKVDVLALGMLTAIRKGFEMIEDHYDRPLSLATVPREEPRVYEMLSRADSLGVFQVESRAQMNMLPRIRPNRFYDLVIQVAIVRPGPIQGDMVHPYLRRRKGLEEVHYPSPSPEHGPADELKRVLGKTLGVPLFQEQAMRIAIEAAKLTPDEANGLRRAMATFKRVGTIHEYERKMVEGMVSRGYDRDFAERCFKQIEGFGEYGFPESHAASFAHLVYVSAWIKCEYPDVFAAALLNSQPMGFYAPAQIVRDAREHGVEARHPDVNASFWDCTLERPRAGAPPFALRLGLRQIDGFRQAWAEAIAAARATGGPFASVADLRARSGVPAHAIEKLAEADALGSLKLNRRGGTWAAKGLPRAPDAPLFAAAGVEEADGAPPIALPAASASEEVVDDYQTIRLSLKGHPVGFLRERFAREGARTAAEIAALRDGRPAAMAGVVLVRQRPGSAGGVMFMTLEDETGVVNVVVWPKLFELHRPILMGARLVVVKGRVQRSEGVTHLVMQTVEDRTEDLRLLSDTLVAPEPAHADERAKSPGSQPWSGGGRNHHPRDARILPPAREFH